MHTNRGAASTELILSALVYMVIALRTHSLMLLVLSPGLGGLSAYLDTVSLQWIVSFDWIHPAVAYFIPTWGILLSCVLLPLQPGSKAQASCLFFLVSADAANRMITWTLCNCLRTNFMWSRQHDLLWDSGSLVLPTIVAIAFSQPSRRTADWVAPGGGHDDKAIVRQCPQFGYVSALWLIAVMFGIGFLLHQHRCCHAFLQYPDVTSGIPSPYRLDVVHRVMEAAGCNLHATAIVPGYGDSPVIQWEMKEELLQYDPLRKLGYIFFPHYFKTSHPRTTWIDAQCSGGRRPCGRVEILARPHEKLGAFVLVVREAESVSEEDCDVLTLSIPSPRKRQAAIDGLRDQASLRSWYDAQDAAIKLLLAIVSKENLAK